ncbi:hypothetical protein DFH09DRAFT_1109796 [Mycena vulgaris]|nr:hypothetical protein DFH09DRAFT_1109796 [Mycena vulgaris]
MATKACGLYTRPGRGGAIRGVRVRADEGVRGLRKTTLALRIRGRGDGIRVVYAHSGEGEGLRGGGGGGGEGSAGGWKMRGQSMGTPSCAAVGAGAGPHGVPLPLHHHGRRETYLSLSRRGTGGKAAPMDSSGWVSRRLQPEGARWAGEGVSAAAMRVDKISMFGEWKWIPDGRSTSTAWGALNYVWSAPFDHNVCNPELGISSIYETRYLDLERVEVGIRSRSKQIWVWGRGLEITSGWGLTRAHTIGVGLRTMNSTIKGMKWITTRSTGTRPTVQYIVLNSEAKRTGKPIQRLQSFRSARFVHLLKVLLRAWSLGNKCSPDGTPGGFQGQAALVRGSVEVGGFFIASSDPECTTRDACHQTRKKDRPLDKYPNAFWDILRSQMCPHCFAKARDDHSASLRSFWRRIPTTFRLPPWPELYAMERDVMGEARSKPAAEDANVVIFALGLRNMGIKPELGLGSWYSGINMIIRSQGRHLYMMQQRRLIWTRSRSMAVLDQDAGAVGGPVYPRTDALARAEIIFVFKSSRRTKLGNHLRGSASVVLRSESPDIRVGKYVYDFAVSHQEYSVITVVHDQQIIEKHPGLPWTAHLGAAGMPGTQVKWHGWLGRSIHMLNFVRSGKLRGKLNTVQKEIGFVTTGAVYAASRDVPHARVWTTAIEPKFVQMGNEATIIRRETSFCGNSERN